MNAVTPLVVGVTSHRNIPASEMPALRQHVRELFARLQHEFPHLPLTLLSSLAEGGDQLVAEEALQAGAKLIAPLPFAREFYARDFVDAAVRARFEALCAKAQVIELPLLAGHTRGVVALASEQRNRQYAQAGTFVAWHCQLLIAIWDGKPSQHVGGTAQIVDYFLTGALPGGVGPRRDLRARLYGGGGERLMYHLVCSRDVLEGQPAAPLKAGQALWRGPDEVSVSGAPMPREVHKVFAYADAFNRDAAYYARQIAATSPGIAEPETAAGGAAAPAYASVMRLFHAADWLANLFQKRVLLAMRVIYSVAFLMGLTFAAYDNLAGQDRMLYVFLALFVVGVLMSAVAKLRGWHRKYLDYRALAEGLRVQCYWLRAGIALDGDSGSGQDSLLQKQEMELAWVRNVMRSAGLAGQPGAEAFGERALAGVIEEWVGDERHGELGYYRLRTRQREHAHRANEVIGAVCLLIGLGISIMMAVLMHWLSFEAKHDWIVAMAAFSIFAAVRESYAFRKADRELIRQYRFMERVFGNARAALDQAHNAEQQREILRALGEAALDEHVAWAVMHRQRPLEGGKM